MCYFTQINNKFCGCTYFLFTSGCTPNRNQYNWRDCGRKKLVQAIEEDFVQCPKCLKKAGVEQDLSAMEWMKPGCSIM
ncbi:hypothetical protein TWF481_004782 [Arthrobotrys musiformis]|uniref:Zinc finger GRF-type domain-containing protein n=1 Tax=Arthrobotrys musiformis TaxID=47236 RepID=A0AAV9WMK4_9PEZI